MERKTLQGDIQKVNEVLGKIFNLGPLDPNREIPKSLLDIIADNDVYLRILTAQPRRQEHKVTCGLVEARLTGYELKELTSAQ